MGSFRVSRDGQYGAQNRQLYRCTDRRSGAFHRFAPELPRERTPGGTCAVCDSVVAPHLGPVFARTYGHRLHLVAEALVAVGRGVSYSRAAQRARAASGRAPLQTEGSGQLVAEWVDAWAPVIIDALAETEQPETLVIDGTDFWWTNSRNHARRQEFSVMVAYGYTGPHQGRVWGVYAAPHAKTADYVRLLRRLQLPGPPVTVVSDADKAIAAAVRSVWRPTPGPSAPVPFPFACEHHLRLSAQKALAADKADPPLGRWMRRLDTAFRRPESWEEFRDSTAVLGRSAAWTKAHDSALSVQVGVRALLPAHHSNAAAEAALATLRGLFEQRSFAFRNASRTNLLLGLARLHLNNRDDVDIYHQLLRRAAENQAGHAQTIQRRNSDRRDKQGNPRPSLR